MSKFCGYNVHSAELLAIISDIANNSALCCCDLLREVGLPVTHTHTHTDAKKLCEVTDILINLTVVIIPRVYMYLNHPFVYL